ncbi:MAG: PIN domain-containing protein [Phycisphaeraceae bacterium]|nr:PIN domain-containing protein [Phycisphaerales bacterium]QOJ18240.1 MAG: PIN domain-containing protein [Phycisphaeraceae bacterium]
MNAVDTNVLLYAHDPRDLRKQQRALECVRTLSEGVLLWQVACEYLAAARKLEPFGFSLAKAEETLVGLRSIWACLQPRWSALDRAMDLTRRFSLSFWDAMIVANCLDHGVESLLTEDLGGTPTIDGLRIINPFRE